MDFKVVITRSAIKDLEEITHLITKDDSQSAELFGNLLIDRDLSLQKFPKIGRKVPEFNDATIREISHTPYRIIYRLRPNTNQIHILHFWHAARGKPSF
jgi:plasmid stabilization system protein ParE